MAVPTAIPHGRMGFCDRSCMVDAGDSVKIAGFVLQSASRCDRIIDGMSGTGAAR
jgi:hypothetical protein